MAETVALCRLADIADGGSAAVDAVIAGARRPLMLLRRGRQVYVYENRCPHLGWPLDIVPGRFLDASGRYILCTGHGALFRVDDGNCLKGPCIGEALTTLAARVVDGMVTVESNAPSPDRP